MLKIFSGNISSWTQLPSLSKFLSCFIFNMFLSAAICITLWKTTLYNTSSCLSFKIFTTVCITFTQIYGNPADKMVLPPLHNLQFCHLEQQIIFKRKITFEVTQKWRFYFRFLVWHCTVVWWVTLQRNTLSWTSKMKFRVQIWKWKALCQYSVPDNIQ